MDLMYPSELNEIHNVKYNEIQRVAFTWNAALSMLKDNIQNTCDVSEYFHWIAEFCLPVMFVYITSRQFAVGLSWLKLTVNCACSHCVAVGFQACLQTIYILKSNFLISYQSNLQGSVFISTL